MSVNLILFALILLVFEISAIFVRVAQSIERKINSDRLNIPVNSFHWDYFLRRLKKLFTERKLGFCNLAELTCYISLLNKKLP